MKVKMIDVAKRLGVSKAAVSLAVNGKPGVSEETREKILACIKEMEKETSFAEDPSADKPRQKYIRIINISHGIAVSEMDLWTPVYKTYISEISKYNYSMTLHYLNDDTANNNSVVHECNRSSTAGVIVAAHELIDNDLEFLEQIHKPIIFYDFYLQNGKYSSVCINNEAAVELMVDQLGPSEKQEAVYFAANMMLPVFKTRRNQYVKAMRRNGFDVSEADIIHIGYLTNEMSRNFRDYLDTHALPKVILCENYQVAIGILTVLNERGIKYPDETRLVAIDLLPKYIPGQDRVTQIFIPHVSRAKLTVETLIQEIEDPSRPKLVILAAPHIAGPDDVII